MPDTTVPRYAVRKFAAYTGLLCFLLGFAPRTTLAQGWLRFYPTYAFNISQMVVTPNGDAVLAGYDLDPGQSNYYFQTQRIDATGLAMWQQRVSFPGQNDAFVHFVENCPGGGVVAGGTAKIDGLATQAIFRISDAGDTLWTRLFFAGTAGNLFSATPTPDGKLLVAGNRRGGQNNVFSPTLAKLDPADGSVIWSKFYPDHPQDEYGGSTRYTPGGDILHTSNCDTAFVRRLDADGNLIWERPVLPVYFSDYGIIRRPLNDGFTWMQRQGDEMLFRRYDYDGNVLSVKLIPNMGYLLSTSTQSDEAYAFVQGGWFAGPDTFPKFRKLDFAGQPGPEVFPLEGLSTGLIFWAAVLEATPDGGYLIAGGNIGQSSVFLLKVDANGHYEATTASGRVFRDDNSDCLESPGETPLSPVLVQANEQVFGTNWYETTDSAGAYAFTLPAGDYEITTLEPGGATGYWQACPPVDAFLPVEGDHLDLDPMGVQPLVDCPLLQLDVAAGFFRPCSTTVVAVRIFNAGTAGADSATVWLSLDPLLTYDSSSIAPFAQNGNLIGFHAGALASLADTAFRVFCSVDCAAQLGQVLCIDGHVSPDSLCAVPNPAWDGAELHVEAQCEGDSVHFRVVNVGTGDMSQASDLVIIEDYIILRMVPLLLPAGKDTVIAQGGNANQTYYGRIRQTEGFPGPVFASDGEDYCYGAGEAGMLLQYPLFSGGPFDARHCDEVRTAFDPNDKRGFPLGYGPSHFIESDQTLRYVVRFQNTGNDTAFTVVVRDTLPESLDVSSLRIGAASHPFEWALSGANTLSFRFDNILLPDSATNEPASHGFVAFSLTPKTGLYPGTLVENRAAIYFDYNAPVFTANAWHTIGYNFVQVGTLPVAHKPVPMVSIFASPNPAAQSAQLELHFLPEAAFPLQLTICDVFGKTLRQESVSGPKHLLNRGDLPQGICLIKLAAGSGALLGTGKIVWSGGQ